MDNYLESLARSIMLGGIVLFLLGAGLYLSSKFEIPIGRLPGDIRIEGENGGFYFPVASSILISVIITIMMNFIMLWIKKR